MQQSVGLKIACKGLWCYNVRNPKGCRGGPAAAPAATLQQGGPAAEHIAALMRRRSGAALALAVLVGALVGALRGAEGCCDNRNCAAPTPICSAKGECTATRVVEPLAFLPSRYRVSYIDRGLWTKFVRGAIPILGQVREHSLRARVHPCHALNARAHALRERLCTR